MGYSTEKFKLINRFHFILDIRKSDELRVFCIEGHSSEHFLRFYVGLFYPNR